MNMQIRSTDTLQIAALASEMTQAEALLHFSKMLEEVAKRHDLRQVAVPVVLMQQVCVMLLDYKRQLEQGYPKPQPHDTVHTLAPVLMAHQNVSRRATDVLVRIEAAIN